MEYKTHLSTLDAPRIPRASRNTLPPQLRKCAESAAHASGQVSEAGAVGARALLLSKPSARTRERARVAYAGEYRHVYKCRASG